MEFVPEWCLNVGVEVHFYLFVLSAFVRSFFSAVSELFSGWSKVYDLHFMPE